MNAPLGDGAHGDRGEATSGLGPLLTQARLARGLGREEVARSLSVPVTLIAALEEERLEAFDALIYLKGHAQRYGRFLECPPDELERAIADVSRRYLLARPPRVEANHKARTAGPGWGLVAISSVVFLALVGVYLWVGSQNSGSIAKPSVVHHRAPLSIPPLVGHLPRPKPLMPPPTPLLVLVVHGTSWISVRDLKTGVSLFRGLAPPPHHLRFFAPGRYHIVLGRAQDVTILLHGRVWHPPALPPGRASERFVIDVSPISRARGPSSGETT